MTSRLLIEYDGSDFAGWARQPRLRTVQGVLEDALERVTRRQVTLTVAGRTDAGVHARGQVASHEGPPAPSPVRSSAAARSTGRTGSTERRSTAAPPQ